ncbi:pyridoxamine 5'-phosphate oxidase family protein [Saccharospirillum impatiens]|uniref:pyridoxamine 5'-phosphate oxidase family protein n=1 Tax=Saccharospirillum impatiens TaxID=169438 RepID=UPI0003FD8CE5|nr:pyridoxamine 5'-phosphate oxidase family protein [Saccharospirillum impatiens]
MSTRLPDPNTPLHTGKSHVKRGPGRARYDIEQLHAIIDATLLCTVAQSLDGQPFVTPTCHWRDGDYLYWHGHAKARNLAPGQPVCINILQMDGLVLARSAFHHSINYRSATLFGNAEAVTGPEEKARQLRRFVDRISPDRWDALRPMTDNELKATGLSRILISEASCKIRAEGVNDDAADTDWPVWAGVMPLEKHWGAPIQEAGQATYSVPRLPLNAR